MEDLDFVNFVKMKYRAKGGVLADAETITNSNMSTSAKFANFQDN